MGLEKMRFFCLQEKNLPVHKTPRFLVGGGVFWVFLGGGGDADFIFMGAVIFPNHRSQIASASLKALNSLISGSGPFWPYFPSDC